MHFRLIPKGRPGGLFPSARRGTAALLAGPALALSALNFPPPPPTPSPAMPYSVAQRIGIGPGVQAQTFCAVVGDGDVRCWGDNTEGQAGYGNSAASGRAYIGDHETPGSQGPVWFGGPAALAVAVGDQHACALLDDQRVRCWGTNQYGQLGVNSTTPVGQTDTPASSHDVELGFAFDVHGTVLTRREVHVTQIATGGGHSCAILENGKVACWGDNSDGQLGYGNTTNVGDGIGPSPLKAGYVNLGSGRTAVAIAAGERHTCALLDNGTVLCWGDNSAGQLGLGNTDNIGDDETPNSVTPIDFGDLTVKAISAGGDDTCVILSDATLRCWGSGAYGKLGYGSTGNYGDDQGENPADEPAVSLGGDVAQVSAGNMHTCAVLTDGSSRCWGRDDFGDLGLYPSTLDSATSTPDSVDPIDLGGDTAVAIQAGGYNTCAVLQSGRVLCWGLGRYGANGQASVAADDLGDNETPGSVPPIKLGDTIRTLAEQIPGQF